jgi:rubrerythrin
VTTEQDKVLEALQIAIQMETEGKECYLEANKQSTNEVGRKLLQSLADEEDIHRRRFQEIYEAIRNKRAWPKIVFCPDSGEKLRDRFARTCAMIGVNVSGGAGEFDAIEAAVEKEKESYDFYHRQSEQAIYDAEREFYEAVAVEEREHELVLLDYYEYLTNPAGFFIKKEHHSLDGG